MPNTLAHIAVQTLAAKPFSRNQDLFAPALLGCIIPDLPWILQRLLNYSPVAIDPYTLRAYVTVQAALFMSLMFAGACALLFAHSTRVFATIVAGCILHLCLDAAEIKWANGAHFFAPLDWHQVNWGLVWPEHAIVGITSLFGVPVFGYLAWQSASQPIRIDLDPRRVRSSAFLILIYFSAPAFFIGGPFQGNSHFLDTLADFDNRPEQYIELDRADVFRNNDEWYARTYAQETIRLESFDSGQGGTYSLRGYFSLPTSIQVTDWHRHNGRRDMASVAGLFLFCSWFLITVLRQSGLRGYL